MTLTVRAPAPGLWEMTMPGLAESVREARELARTASFTPYQAEAAALCVSELVTNAIVHTRSGQPGGLVTVTIGPAPAPGELRITVGDDGGHPGPPGPWCVPAAVDGPVIPEGGYGLAIVDAIVADWGRFTCMRGWCTWCDIPDGEA